MEFWLSFLHIHRILSFYGSFLLQPPTLFCKVRWLSHVLEAPAKNAQATGTSKDAGNKQTRTNKRGRTESTSSLTPRGPQTTEHSCNRHHDREARNKITPRAPPPTPRVATQPKRPIEFAKSNVSSQERNLVSARGKKGQQKKEYVLL